MHRLHNVVVAVTCESGWTFYLGQPSYSQTRCQKLWGSFDEEDGGKGARFVVEAEEDLSMVSDASSGPRHNCEDEEDGSFCSDPAARAPAKKKETKEDVSNQHHSCLDEDTANSPAISFSKKKCGEEASLDLSQGFSGTYVKGKSAFQKKLGFLKSEEAGSEDAAGDFLGMTKG